MIIEQIAGGYRIADIIGGYRVSRRYFGYTRREAIRLFTQEARP